MSIPAKGQDTQLVIISNGQALATISDFTDTEFSFTLERLTRSYLGKTSDSYDEIFKGFKVTTTLNFENQDVFQFIQDVVNRAKRRNTNLQINIQCIINIPGGDRPKFYGNNLFFNDFPVNFASRSAYGTVKIDGMGEDAVLKLS